MAQQVIPSPSLFFSSFSFLPLPFPFSLSLSLSLSLSFSPPPQSKETGGLASNGAISGAVDLRSPLFPSLLFSRSFLSLFVLFSLAFCSFFSLFPHFSPTPSSPSSPSLLLPLFSFPLFLSLSLFLSFSLSFFSLFSLRLLPCPLLGYSPEDKPYPRGEVVAHTPRLTPGYFSNGG